MQLHYKYSLIGLCTFSELQNRPQRKKKQQFFNLMYIMLLKVYYSSFPVFPACTFDWLIDGRFLVKTKLNHLINSICFWVRSITETAYILVRNTEITVWKWKVKSTVHGTWNMGKKISVCWCQNRLTYVMVLIQIHTLLHFEQFIL